MKLTIYKSIYIDFSNLAIIIKEGATPSPYPSLAAAQAAGAVTINYGLFINTIINFLIIAAVVFFLIVRPLAKMQSLKKGPRLPRRQPKIALSARRSFRSKPYGVQTAHQTSRCNPG
jgi:large-conductance mechanosensitive channel